MTVKDQNDPNTTHHSDFETNDEVQASKDGNSFVGLDAALKRNPKPIPKIEDEHVAYPVVFSDSTSLINAYAQVVEERKVLLAEAHVEKAMVEFANKSVAQHLKDNDPVEVLENALNIYREFDSQVSFGENVQNGIATYYRILEGKTLKRMKELVEEQYGKRKWVGWVEKNIHNKTYRVIRQYIQLAETPNVFHYAPLGKELLVKIIAMLKSNKKLYGKDPIGSFLSIHGIMYNPEMDQGPEHLETMHVIRVAMNYQKIIDANLETDITRDQVERLVNKGKIVTQALISELKTAEEDGKDIVAHMEAILEDKGRLQGLKSVSEKQAEVRSAFDSFAKLTREVYKDAISLEGLSSEQIEDLLVKLEDLQDKLNEEDDDPDGDGETVMPDEPEETT